MTADDLPTLAGATVTRVDDDHMAIQVDQSLVTGFTIAAIAHAKEHGISPGVMAQILLSSAWMVMALCTDMEPDKRRDWLMRIVGGMLELPAKGEIQ